MTALISTLWQCWRERRFLTIEESLLLLLAIAFLIVFSFPSQRSGRYLLPVMPAFAALIALHWERLPLWGFRIALILQIMILAILIWLGSRLQLSVLIGGAGSWTYSYAHWFLMGASVLLALAGLFKRDFCKTAALASCFLVYCALNSSLSPLEGQMGRYSPAVIAQVQDKDVWIPCDYRAKDEEYRLLLPGGRLHGYLASEAGEAAQLSANYPLVLVQAPLGVKPLVCDSCQILGQRMEMRARHSDEEIIDMLKGNIAEHLFVNEFLVATPVLNSSAMLDGKDACR